MIPEERDLAFLQIILLLVERTKAHLAKVTQAEFVENDDDIDLLAYRLSMIGEYANKLSSTFRTQHDRMPWIKMIGLRHIVAHEYRRVEPGRIWTTATTDLDALEGLCREQIALRES